jgi:hypothetical protein
MVTMIEGARSTQNILQVRRKDKKGKKSSKASKRGKNRSKARR